VNPARAKWGAIAGVLFGAAAGTLIPVLTAATTKRMLLASLAVVSVVAVLLLRNPARWFLASMILLMPVNINYFLFQRYAPHIGGAPGLYLVACDLPLIVLYALWFFDATVPRIAAERRSMAYFALYTPFFVLAGLSVAYASNQAWAGYEFVRWIRVALILLYASQRVKLEEVHFCMYALAGSVMVQGTMGALQTAFRTNFGMDKLGIAGRGSESVFEQQIDTMGTVVRGAGTMGHPNILGPYLAMIVPVFVLLSIVDTHRIRRTAWVLTSLAGMAGLASTLSRASWASFLAGMAAAAVALWVLRLLEPKRVMTLVSAGGLVLLAVLVPMTPVIMKRLQTDYSDSVRFRVELNQVAGRIIRDHPLTGVGLNNFTVISPKYIPDDKQYIRSLEGLVPAVHNLYLLVGAELGLLGLGAFLLFWLGSFGRALRRPQEIPPLARATLAGLACGFMGLLLADFAGFALWTDANMWTLALLIGLFEPFERVRQATA
jgi:putative inorganic carbon (hco3(-)) transporter